MRPALLVAIACLGAVIVFALLRRPMNPEPNEHAFSIGESHGGSPIIARQIGRGQDTGLLVIASIHGSEPAGRPVAEALADWAKSNPAALNGRRLVIVPNANPDGLALGRRLNRNGVDLNRNFPAGNRVERARYGEDPLSEPEAQALYQLIADYQPAAIVSIHQPLACIDYDGPAGELATAMAAACELPVKRLGSRPGSLGAYFGETLGRPIITLELPERPATPVESFLPALQAAVRHTHSPNGSPAR